MKGLPGRGGGGAKFQIFFEVLGVPDIFGGDGRCYRPEPTYEETMRVPPLSSTKKYQEFQAPQKNI